MASEMRRAAKALVQATPARFAFPVSRDDARARLRTAMRPQGPLDGEVTGDSVRLWEAGRRDALAGARFDGRWAEEDGQAVLEGAFPPAPRIERWLRAASVALGALVLASAWLWLADDSAAPLRFLVLLATILAILAFPLGVLALASQRQAAEARICRALRSALEAPR